MGELGRSQAGRRVTGWSEKDQDVESQPQQVPHSVYGSLKRILKNVLFVCLTMAFLARAFVRTLDFYKTRSEFCLTDDCIAAAAQIYQNLASNFSDIDPCSSFEEYACGGFKNHHKLRPDQSGLATLTLMFEQNQETLRYVLEKSPSEIIPKDRSNFQKLKTGYDACMNMTAIESHGLVPLQQIIDKLKDKYPIDSLRTVRNSINQVNIQAASKSLGEVVTYLTSIGVENVLQLYVGADDKHPDVQVIFVGPPSRIGLPSKEYYRNEKLVADYKKMIELVLPEFLRSDAISQHTSYLSVEDMVTNLISFETKLAEARPAEEDLEDVIKAYNPMNISELQELAPEVSFEEVFSKLAPPEYTANRTIVSSPSYLQDMSEIVRDTPKEIVQAYLVWKTIQAYASRAEDPVLEPFRRFWNLLDGKEPDAREDRWRTCIRSCDGTMGWSLSKFYVDEAFSPEDKQFGDQIIDDIKESFVGLLREAKWMEPEVREIAEKKVAAIDKKIGYPVSNPDILDAKALEKYYAKLEISEQHFENGLNAAQFEISMDWAKLGKPTRHDEWGMTAPTVNAYYNPAGNEIVFPAGIMQSPVFYSPSIPQYLTYGSFAAVAGHELSHAFDSNGASYDETGRLRDWWTKETKAAFDNKTTCFVGQYANYTIVGPDNEVLHVNGRLTLGENIADAGGLHAAFKSWDRRGRPGKKLPLLPDFSKEQMFFLSYANAWCGIITPESAAQRIYRDPHSPGLIRVLGTTANSAAFRTAFGCPVKEPTCELW